MCTVARARSRRSENPFRVLSRSPSPLAMRRTIFRCLAGLAVVGCANPEQSVDKEEEHDAGPEHHTIVEEWDEVVPDQNVVWLEENAKSEGVITLPSGLQYKILASGPPTGQRPNASDPCTCHYEGATPAAPRLCLRRGFGAHWRMPFPNTPLHARAAAGLCDRPISMPTRRLHALFVLRVAHRRQCLRLLSQARQRGHIFARRRHQGLDRGSSDDASR